MLNDITTKILIPHSSVKKSEVLVEKKANLISTDNLTTEHTEDNNERSLGEFEMNSIKIKLTCHRRTTKIWRTMP